jgi:hypothetical protein
LGTGYSGTYKGTVVSNVDPTVQNRLLVAVPEIGGEPAWADPIDAQLSGSVPSVGEDVTILFAGGDSEHPVWQAGAASGPSVPPSGGYGGVYQATVINNLDPTQANRLQVSVPEALGQEVVWADPSQSVGSQPAVPEIGSTVRVRFDGGDVNHPVWLDAP